MLTTGLSLAVLTVSGFYMIYLKLPASIQAFMQKHALLTDITACVLTYALFGGTIVSLFAAAFVGLFVSILLALMNDPRTRGSLENMTKQIGMVKDKLINGLAKICEQHTVSKVN